MARMSRMLASAAVVLALGWAYTVSREPLFASDTECATWAGGTFCGVNSECIKVWVDDSGQEWCQEYRFYNVYVIRPGVDGCVYTRGQYSCPTDPK